MIVYLKGTLHSIGHDHIVVLAQGVGYQVFLAKTTLETMPPIASPIELNIHAVFREDNQQLFGFQSQSEKAIFLKLIQVNSIGPKLALTILSGLPAQDLAEAVRSEDLGRLTAIPGVGKKTAERLIVDLKDKILELMPLPGGQAGLKKGHGPLSHSEAAISALTNLGYSRVEAQIALKKIPMDQEMPLEVMVREGLKALS